MTELARCPCGKTPDFLMIEGDADQPEWARCAGNCCLEWWFEYRNIYHETDSIEAAELAEKAWNEAPRGKFDAAYWMQVVEEKP